MAEIRFNPQRGELVLTCREEEFSKLLGTLVVEASAVEVVGDQSDKIRRVFLAKESDVYVRSRWNDRVVLVGCAFVAFCILMVLWIGAATIVGWMR